MTSLSQMKADLHDRLWNAQQRWFAMRRDGSRTKHEIKMAGVREFGDQNPYMRPILFCGRSRVTYERVLKSFLEFAHAKFGVQRLDDVDTPQAKSFLDDAIERGLAAKTLQRMSSALAKAGCLIGRSASFIALAERYSRKIRELAATGEIVGPTRATPSPDVVREGIEILRAWDARHFERTDEPRAYHLVARLQVETSCRSVSATARVTADSLLEGWRIALSAKGGRLEEYLLSPDLHRLLSLYLRTYGGRLADQNGYRMAYKRAIEAAGGRVTGTHGLRRLSVQSFYRQRYRAAVGDGLSPEAAAECAAGDAIERLGHSRNRADHRRAYLGR